MNGAEATAKWEAEKAVLMKELVSLPIDEKKQLIKKAVTYRSGTDSCNSVYMGSIATSKLCWTLGGVYGNDSVPDLLKKANEAQVDKALDVCAPYIDSMNKNPTKPCPCCSQLVPDTGKKYKVSILWGEAHEEGDEANTYEFDTQVELDAFLLGVSEMDGWLGYEVTEEGFVWHSDVGDNND